jgi:methyl acetate hydrolase
MTVLCEYRWNNLDAALCNAVARKDVPMAVGLLTDPQRTIYTGACGTCSTSTDALLNENSVFYIASMTKPITTAAALLLVDRGLLDLDSPVAAWVPGAARLRVFDRLTPDGTPVYRSPARPITPRDLITHSAGFAHPAWNAAAHQHGWYSVKTDPQSRPGDLLGVHPLLFDPGTDWAYSGFGIDLLSDIIERICDQPIGTFLRQNFFAPLGMESTGWSLGADMFARRVDEYRRLGDGTLIFAGNSKPAQPELEYGSGGLFSTAADYACFLRFILSDGTTEGKRLLSRKVLQAMRTSAFTSARVGLLRSADPHIARDIDFFHGARKSWSLGFLINDQPATTGRSAGSLGWFGSLNTYFWIDPAQHLAGIFLTQLSPCADERAVSAFETFETAYYADIGAV